MRVAYQTPLVVTTPGSVRPEAAYPYTFEDALAFENLALFAALKGTGLVGKFHEAIAEGGSVTAIGQSMYHALKNGKKAEFALDVLELETFDDIAIPRYIAEGLDWLLNQLKKKRVEILPQEEPSEQTDKAET